jgi:hypothetical protein
VVVWVWGTVAAVIAAGDRADVVAVAADVGRFETIDRSDLMVVRVGADRDVGLVPAGDLDEVVGRAAAVDLVAGSLLSPNELVAADERVVGTGEVRVGARLGPGAFPAEDVPAGAGVLVVVRPSDVVGGVAAVTDVEGWLLSVSDADESTGERSVSLVVPRAAGSAVSAAAADGRVSVVVEG